MGMGPGAEEDYVANLAPMMSSAKMDWRTPASVLDRVRRVRAIGLDPCPAEDSEHWFATSNLQRPKYDGLTAPWMDYVDCLRELVFVNPPYGRALGDWMRACASNSYGLHIIALVPARTDTNWFRWCWGADAICFLRGRITFEGAPAPAPFPSCLPFWGEAVHRFRDAFADAGHIVVNHG